MDRERERDLPRPIQHVSCSRRGSSIGINPAPAVMAAGSIHMSEHFGQISSPDIKQLQNDALRAREQGHSYGRQGIGLGASPPLTHNLRSQLSSAHEQWRIGSNLVD